MSYVFSWFGVANVVSFLVAAFLASFVLKTNPRKDCNRVFALMFIVISIATLSGAMFAFSKEQIWEDVSNISFFPVYGLAIYFVSIFPRRYTIFGINRYAAILLFVPCFIGWTLYFLDSSLFIRSPLWYIVTTLSLFYVILVLVRSYVRARTDIELKQLKYIFVAFAVQGAFSAFYVIIKFFPFLLTLLSEAAVAGASVLVDVLFVALIAYAILKFQLFDIEVKVKKSIKYIMVTAVLVSSLIFINELVESYIGSLFSGEMTILTACLVGAFFIPVERLCKKGTDKLFPKVSDSEEHYSFKKAEIYKATLEEAWVDGTVTEKEKKMLKSLREKLGISEKDHRKLEVEVKKGYKL